MTPADLRRLSEYAERGGADRVWLERVAAVLIEQQLEFAEAFQTAVVRVRQH